MLFPFETTWWIYLSFIGLVLILLLVDLGIFNRTPHRPSFKESVFWTSVWIGVAVLVNWGLYHYTLVKFPASPELASKVALEFFTGYVVEKTLAVDNIFVFAMVFAYFKVEAKFQHRILFWGIIGALVFRSLFIALGSQLMNYHGVVIFFGILLILTGLKMAFHDTEGNLDDRWLLKTLKKKLPLTTDDGEGSFFIRKNKTWFVTPLFLALLVIEFSDIIFAIDSVPAIFALTKEPLIVFTSNIMAILGLRAMYFMILGVMDRFIYIKYGLAAVLVFVGLKMAWLNPLFDGKFPIKWSLLIILSLIMTSILFSLLKTRAIGFGQKLKMD
jgi:tellurite resistance protein TerC